jgi:transcriptional regulator with GAF, ATPase, and Fis domain
LLVILRKDQKRNTPELLRLRNLEVLTMASRPEENTSLPLSVCRRTDHPDDSLARLRARLGLEHIVGESPAFTAFIQQIPLIARYDVSLLILGETGTGKEVFARAIHYCSPRAGKPFIPVNCGAIPVDLLENEFFGHESGAFTSANSSRRGVIKEADGYRLAGATLFDQIHEQVPHAYPRIFYGSTSEACVPFLARQRAGTGECDPAGGRPGR